MRRSIAPAETSFAALVAPTSDPGLSRSIPPTSLAGNVAGTAATAEAESEVRGPGPAASSARRLSISQRIS